MKKVRLFVAVMLVSGAAFLTSATSAQVEAQDPPLRPIGECICLDVFQPVCIIATGQQFSNACYASCAGYTPSEWTDCYLQ